MQRILMCPPRYFEVCYDINPWMENNAGKVDYSLAQQQWQNLYQHISRLAQVVLIEPVAGLPDMVFTANAGSVRGNWCVVSTFRHRERQGETAYFAQFFTEQGYILRPFSQPVAFEGAGDALFDRDERLWMGTGFRSDPHALSEVGKLLQVPVFGLELIDPRWYHLDTAFCPLNNGHIMAYAGAFSPASRTLLQDTFGQHMVWVSELDALNFACNAVNIGQHIILHQASHALQQQLSDIGFTVIENNVSEFMKAGGACKCLTLAL